MKNRSVQPQKDLLVTIREAAEILCLPEKTVYNGNAGTYVFRRVKLGKNVRLVREEVMDFRRRAIGEATTIQRVIAEADWKK